MVNPRVQLAANVAERCSQQNLALPSPLRNIQMAVARIQEMNTNMNASTATRTERLHVRLCRL